MVTRRNGIDDPDDPIDEWEYQRALEMYNGYIMDRVETLLEDDNYRNLWNFGNGENNDQTDNQTIGGE
jgi:hypothetical protein